MHHSRVDALTRSLSTAHSRRGALLALLSGELGLRSLTETAAKKHKKKKKRHRAGLPPAAPPSPPPDPGGPTALADAACVAAGEVAFGYRLAQTFRALRAGSLTSATVYIAQNTGGVDLDIELWSVDETNAPGTVLAGATIANVPATVFPGPPRPLTATFATPALVVGGLRYALVVTGPYFAWGWQGAEGDPCPEGQTYFKNDPANPWSSGGPVLDLQFDTTVTA